MSVIEDGTMDRRNFLTALAGGVAGLASPSLLSPALAASPGAAGLRAGDPPLPRLDPAAYATFLQGVRQQALAASIPAGVVDQALALAARPNQDVLRLDRHQPEFTLTWAQYRERVLPSSRQDQGRQIYQHVRDTLSPIARQEGCDDGAVMGIWGLESGFGARQGHFNVIQALASLAFEGRRAAFFRNELLKALQILATGAITPEAMLGSYAGAMGQAQFMPSAYLRYGADGDGDGKCNIWSSQADVFASIANYLGHSGWQRGEPWGEEVRIPLGENGHFTRIAATSSRHAPQHPLGVWQALGVQSVSGGGFLAPQGTASLIQPDGPGGQAFLVYRNFYAIRAYNPSDYYALAVGILGDRITR